MPYTKRDVSYNDMSGYALDRSSNDNGASWIESPTNTKFLQKWENSVDGDYLPDWKNRVKNMVGATTNCDGFKFVVNSTGFCSWFTDAHYGNFGFLRVSSFTGNPSQGFYAAFHPVTSPSLITSVNNRAKALFVQKAQQELSSFESGQDLGELKQTIEAIIHPLKSLRTHVSSYFASVKKLKHRYKDAVSLRKAVADTYLEWTFGWVPLTHDIADGIVGLSNTRLPAHPVESHAHGEEINYQNYSPTIGGTIPYRADTYVKSICSVRMKGMVSCYIDGEPPSLQQELRLLPRDFVPTAWDLLPYSFVVDYFLNVGDVISAFSFPSSALKWCNFSQRSETVLRETYHIDRKHIAESLYVPPWEYTVTESGSPLEMVATSFSRRSFSPSDLVPQLAFSLPLSSKPWENIAALIAGSKRSLCPLW